MNRIELAEKFYQTWFRGQTDAREGIDPEFQEITRRFLFGDVIASCALSDKQKALIVLAALTTCQTLKPISMYALSALNLGAAPEEIRETLYQCAPYIGVEKVWRALEEVGGTIREAGDCRPPGMRATVTEDSRFEKGLAVQREIFGAETIDAMRASAPHDLRRIQDFLTAYCFGDFYTRGTLDLRTRELITFCAICCLGGCEPQAKAHAAGNLKVGNSREQLIEAITQCLPFIGFPRALNAISCIDAAAPASNEEVRTMNTETLKKETGAALMFQRGEKNDAFATYFTGQSYLNMLSTQGVVIGNVTFEPGCRNNWHIHHKGGQILLVTDGRGWYQEWGKPARELRPGDVIHIPPEVRHWHGAAKDSWFAHLAVEVPAEDASNEWLEPVGDEEYDKLK